MKTLFRLLLPCGALMALSAGCSYPEFSPEEFYRHATGDTTTAAATVQGPSVKYYRHSVYSDNNTDGIINNGETVSLDVYLANNGTSKVNGIRATFTSTSQYITGLAPTTAVSYGDISAGAYTWGRGVSSSTTIRFTVSQSTPAGTQIPFSISIVDESGNTWTSSFNITVQ